MGSRTHQNLIVVAAVFAITPLTEAMFAQEKAEVSEEQSQQVIVEAQMKQLLLAMDGDKGGKISKQQWMSAMDAEFDCLDRNGNGEIHLTDLTQASACVDDAGKRLIQTAAHNGYAQRQQLAQARVSSNRH